MYHVRSLVIKEIMLMQGVNNVTDLLYPRNTVIL